MSLPACAARAGTAWVLALSLLPLCGCAEILAQLQPSDAADASTPEDGLREALRIGTGRAVQTLSAVDGFLGSDDVRIPVPLVRFEAKMLVGYRVPQEAMVMR